VLKCTVKPLGTELSEGLNNARQNLRVGQYRIASQKNDAKAQAVLELWKTAIASTTVTIISSDSSG
jgi:hypothetical protein